MEIFGIEVSRSRIGWARPAQTQTGNDPQAASYSDEGSVFSNTGRIPIRSFSFNGEKTPGALGNPVNLVPDFVALRIRAYEANLNNPVIKIITGKFFKWVVGDGLKLQAQPNETVLGLEKVTEDFSAFRANVEPYWNIYANSPRADYSGMLNLHDLEAQHYETKFLGGDVLTVIRIDADLNPTVQVIDGQHVQTPFFNDMYLKAAKKAGNTIFKGVEVDATGRHVAFYVLKNDPNNFFAEYERIAAYGAESGCLLAWMAYGSKQRIDHHRGPSQITTILETVKKLDRYTEATVAGAEERSKIALTVEHDANSDGENPFVDKLQKNINSDRLTALTIQEQAEAATKKIAVSQEKTVVNLPRGAKLKATSSDSEINYDPLWQAIFVQIAASADIPPEVALQKYNSNYSASRAAIMSWGYLVNIIRKKEGNDFKQKIYNVWLYIHILKNKVSANGYLAAIASGNHNVVESYSTARWTGAIMPHIDPKKEADAIRVMLGDPALGEDPLMSRQQAAEQLGLGEWEENYKEYQKEQKLIPKPAVPAQQPPAGEALKPETVTV